MHPSRELLGGLYLAVRGTREHNLQHTADLVGRAGVAAGE